MSLLKKYRTFDEILPQFLAAKQLQVGRKAYLSYTGTSSIFSRWLQGRGLSGRAMKKITPEEIADFFLYIANERKSDRPTCQKHFIVLRGVFAYAKKRGEIEAVPFDKELIVFPKKGKDRSAALIPSHIVPVLLKDLEENDPQLFLACMLEFYCGARPGREVRLLRVRNFDLVEGVLTIDADKTKNGKTGRVTMSEDLVRICREYGIEGADPDLYIFGRNKHLDTRPLSENMLRYRFNKYRDKYNLSKDVKLYSWKHIGASYLVHSKTVDIEQLRQHLRHSNITATAHYVKKITGAQNDAIRTKFPNPLKQSIE